MIKKFFMMIILLVGLNALAYNPIDDGELQKLLQEFDYQPKVEIMKLPSIGCVAQDVEYTTTYPQLQGTLKIQAKAYVPASQESPLVFILPPLGGVNRLDLSMGETLCNTQQIAALVITTKLTGLDGDKLMPVSDHDHTQRRVVSAVKGGIQLMSHLSQIDTKKLGIFGTSLGGILGSLVFGVMPEISAGTFLVNGGDIPFIMARSDQGSIVRVRNLRMQEMGFKTIDEYEMYLRENLKLDPMHFAKLIKPETIKLFLSTADTSVPSEKQLEYYKALGSPQDVLFYNLDHIKTIVAVLALGNQKPKIAEWFKQRFALPNPRIENSSN